MPREWVIPRYDGYEALELRDCAVEEPGPTDVRLAVEAFALNWGDNDLMHDRYSFSFSDLPARVGIEAAGRVEAVGSAVRGIEIGDRYCTLPYFYDKRGASADTMLIDQAYITKAPDGLSAVEAASVWMQYMTAYFPMVELAKAAPGKAIFCPAGTSTAGNAAIRIARMQGATVLTSTRFAQNVAYLKDSGADHVFVDDGTTPVADFLLHATGGRGVDAAFDPVGGDFMEAYAPAMAKSGILFLYGGLRGSYSHPPFLPMIQNSLWFHAYSLFNYVEDAEACTRGIAFVNQALATGALKAQIDRVFAMEEYKDAWTYVRGTRAAFGKVVVETGQ